jgi:hypothetical protein
VHIASMFHFAAQNSRKDYKKKNFVMHSYIEQLVVEFQ